MSLSKIATVSVIQVLKWNNENHGKGLIDKLQEWGLIPNEKICKQCQKLMTVGRDSNRFRWRCQKKNIATGSKCNYSSSITSDTFFDGMHVSLVNLVSFMVMWSKNQTLAYIQSELGLSNKTCVKLSSLFRDVVFDKMITHFEPIGGEGKIVEIDESKFGKRKYNRGHRVEGQWVFGAYEQGSGLIFMVPVEKRDRDTLLPIIHKWIKPGTTIYSDKWKAYDGLDKDPKYHYIHHSVNHSVTYKDPITSACTNGIEGSWRPAKVAYNSSGRRKGSYDGYLAKYMFKKWCLKNGQDPFIALTKAMKIWLESLDSHEIFSDDAILEDFEMSDSEF